MIKSLLLGALLAAVIGILALVLTPRSHVVTAYLLPGIVVGGALSFLIPTRAVYLIDPEAGPAVFLGIVIACSFGFWTLVCGMIHRWWNRKHGDAV
jgi:hypothetical protein